MKFDDNSDYFDTDTATTDEAGLTSETPESPAATETAEATEAATAPKKRCGRLRRFAAWTILAVVIGLGAAMYLRYFNPYVTDAKASGLVVSVERRGIIFKTFEAELAPDDAMTGAPRPYSRESFSFANDSLAREMQQYQGSGTPVTVTYSRYFGILPWRGASQMVITSIGAGR